MKNLWLPFAVSFYLVSQIVAQADDTNIGGVTGALHMLRGGTNVRMVAEEVRISHIATEPKVRARFVFRNEGPATTVTMGFPEEGGGDHGMPRYSDLTNFRSTVDGKRVKVQRLLGDHQGDYTIWWTKRVHFRRGQTRIITESYEGGGGGGDGVGNRWFTYILVSGASWKGTIGHARILCDLSELHQFWPVNIVLNDYRRHGNLIVWDFYHFKPTNDVRVHWIPGFANVVVDGYPIMSGEGLDFPGTQFTSAVNSGSAGCSRLIRDDVRVEARIAADWLDATLEPGHIHRNIGISRGKRWVAITRGSRRVQTSSGKVLYLTHPASEVGAGYTMVNLRPIVEGLGGKMWLDKKQRRVYVTLP